MSSSFTTAVPPSGAAAWPLDPPPSMDADPEAEQRARRGKLVIVAAPSGAGKTTIVRRLLERVPELAFSVSATTRPRRTHETDGKDYYFLDLDGFLERRSRGDFLETEEVYPGCWYGTLRLEVERQWRHGKHVVFDVDVQGARNLKAAYPDRSLALFIQPPSVEALEQRLRRRATEDEGALRVRVAKAVEELDHAPAFDAVVVNDDLETAVDEAERIVRAFLHR
jgi:guanylate kinase